MTGIKWISRIFGKDKPDDEGSAIEKCSVLNIPCDNIRPNRARTRAEFGEDGMLRLAASIRQHGIIQPLVVRKTDIDDVYEYELVAGERRLRAARLLELYCVPCIVLRVDDERLAEISAVENISREGLNMFEIAYAFRDICQSCGCTQEDVAKRLSLSCSYVSGKLRLLKLGYEEQRAIIELALTEEHARSLLRLESSGERMSVIRKIADELLTPREADEYIDRLLGVDKSESFEEALDGTSKTTATAARGIQKRLETLRNGGKDADIEARTVGGYLELRIRIER